MDETTTTDQLKKFLPHILTSQIFALHPSGGLANLWGVLLITHQQNIRTSFQSQCPGGDYFKLLLMVEQQDLSKGVLEPIQQNFHKAPRNLSD